MQAQARPQRRFYALWVAQRVALRGIEQHVAWHGENVAAMQRCGAADVQSGHHLPRRLIGTQNVAVAVYAEQSVGVFTQALAGPAKPHHQIIRRARHQCIFNLACRLHQQVFELGPLDRVNAGHIQHAGAQAVGSKKRHAGAAVGAIGIEEMLTAVQPDRLQLAQCRADGGRADAALRQIRADARDQVGAPIMPVNRTAHVHHHAVRIGKNRKIMGAGDGSAEFFKRRPARFKQRMIALFGAAQNLRRDHVKTHFMPGLLSARQAAPPGAFDPCG